MTRKGLIRRWLKGAGHQSPFPVVVKDQGTEGLPGDGAQVFSGGVTGLAQLRREAGQPLSGNGLREMPAVPGALQRYQSPGVGEVVEVLPQEHHRGVEGGVVEAVLHVGPADILQRCGLHHQAGAAVGPQLLPYRGNILLVHPWNRVHEGFVAVPPQPVPPRPLERLQHPYRPVESPSPDAVDGQPDPKVLDELQAVVSEAEPFSLALDGDVSRIHIEARSVLFRGDGQPKWVRARPRAQSHGQSYWNAVRGHYPGRRRGHYKRLSLASSRGKRLGSTFHGIANPMCGFPHVTLSGSEGSGGAGVLSRTYSPPDSSPAFSGLRMTWCRVVIYKKLAHRVSYFRPGAEVTSIGV